MDDVNKDLVFRQPSEPDEYSSGKTRPRDWTVSEVEEVMWRIRASGGTDSTPIKFSYRAEESIKALHVEAYEYDVPRRQSEPQPQCRACDDTRVLQGTGKVCPVCRDRGEWWYRPAQVLGTLISVPILLIVIAYLWQATIDILF